MVINDIRIIKYITVVFSVVEGFDHVAGPAVINDKIQIISNKSHQKTCSVLIK